MCVITIAKKASGNEKRSERGMCMDTHYFSKRIAHGADVIINGCVNQRSFSLAMCTSAHVYLEQVHRIRKNKRMCMRRLTTTPPHCVQS